MDGELAMTVADTILRELSRRGPRQLVPRQELRDACYAGSGTKAPTNENNSFAMALFHLRKKGHKVENVICCRLVLGLALALILAASGARAAYLSPNPTTTPFALEPTTITLSSGYSVNNYGLYISTTPTGTATTSNMASIAQGYVMPMAGYFKCSDTINGGVSTCLVVNSEPNGASAQGSRDALDVNLLLSGNTGLTGNAFYNAGLFTVQVNGNLGGTGYFPDSLGSVTGYSSQITLGPDASYVTSAFGGEDDVSVQAGTHNQPFWKAGRLITLFSADAQHGSQVDAGLWLDNIASTSLGWNDGILFDSGHSYSPIATGGNIIRANTMTVGVGIDFTQVTCSAAMFASPNFHIDCSGNLLIENALNLGNNQTLAINEGGHGQVLAVAPSGGSNANFIATTAATTGNAPSVAASGRDTNIALNLSSQGNAGVNIDTVNADYLKVAGSASSGVTLTTSLGPLTIIPAVTFSATPLFGTGQAAVGGSANFTLNQGSNGAIFGVNGSGGGNANYIALVAATTGNGAQVDAVGSDSVIDLQLNPKSTGLVTLGGMMKQSAAGFTANGVVLTALTGIGPTGSHTTVQEWLTVQDTGGTVRYVPTF
jgi:hypothetical protein